MTTYFSYLPLNWNFTKTFVIYKHSVGFSLFFGLSLPGDPGHDKSKFFDCNGNRRHPTLVNLKPKLDFFASLFAFAPKSANSFEQ